MDTEPTASAGHVRLPADEQREQLMVQIAKLYYDLERTQSDIASEMGLTRWQVSRLIREAREVGIVRIDIIPRSQRRTDIETRLQQRFGLKDAVVVPVIGDGFGIDAVAEAAGRYLSAMQPKVQLIGVSWGHTMSAVAHYLPPRWNEGAHFVLINGATNLRNTLSRSNQVAESFALSAGGSATIFPAPAVVGKPATREVLEDDPVVANVLELADQASLVCFSLGAMSHRSVLVESGFVSPAEIDGLLARGAVGDCLGRFVDADGNIVDPDLDARTLGLRHARLKLKDRSIAIAAGEEKRGIIRAALKAGFINVLITDAATALYILENAG